MNVGDRLRVDLTSAIVSAEVVAIHSYARVDLKLDTSQLNGFFSSTTETFTKRRNGDWHRQGVTTGRGWKVVQ